MNAQRTHQAETSHDYIQWLFPPDQPSRSVMGAPLINKLYSEDIRQSELARQNLVKSAS